MVETLSEPKRYKVTLFWIVLVTSLTLLIPTFLILMVLGVFPWLSQQAFHSVEEINPDEVEVLRVHLLNHPQEKPDIGPVEMASDDFPKMLKAISGAEPVDNIPAATWLGEYRVRLKDGRRGTIRLYWQRQNPNIATSVPVIWMKIGSNKYRGGEVLELFSVAEECQRRGKLQR